MAERTFGRTVRSHRTKAGFSQAKLGELVGRSPSTIRSWERDRSVPSDPAILVTLAAVLGVDERILFDRAALDMPDKETSPTVEQALASLEPEPEPEPVLELETEPEPVPELETEPEPDMTSKSESAHDLEEESGAGLAQSEPDALAASATPEPAYSAPPPPYRVTQPTPPAAEPSYLEDGSQRQLYRVRTLATIVLLVALVVVLFWAFSNTIDSLGSWWDDFFGQLRL